MNLSNKENIGTEKIKNTIRKNSTTKSLKSKKGSTNIEDLK